MINMICFTVYACETGLLTAEQLDACDYEPLTEVLIPEDIARAFYDDTGACEEVAEELDIPPEKASFELWHDAVYTADSVVGLCDYSRGHGFHPVQA